MCENEDIFSHCQMSPCLILNLFFPVIWRDSCFCTMGKKFNITLRAKMKVFVKIDRFEGVRVWISPGGILLEFMRRLTPFSMFNHEHGSFHVVSQNIFEPNWYFSTCLFSEITRKSTLLVRGYVQVSQIKWNIKNTNSLPLLFIPLDRFLFFYAFCV